MRVIQHAFSGGEYAPELHGRTDLERYDLGAAELSNFVVRYSGGIRKRLPTRFGEFVPGLRARMFPFQFSDVSAESYIAVFGEEKLWLIRNGVFATDLNVSAVSAGGIFSAPLHPFVPGDRVIVAGVVYAVIGITTNTFELITDLGVPFTASGNFGVRRLISFPHPYSPLELFEINMSQRFEALRFSHPAHPRYVLQRVANVWTFAQFAAEGALPLAMRPTITSSGPYIRYVRVTAGGTGYTDANVTLTMTDATGSGFEGTAVISGGAISAVTIIAEGTGYTNPTLVAGGGTDAAFEIGLEQTRAGFAVTVAAVFADGSVSGPMEPAIIRNALDFTQTRGTATYTWPAVPGAVRYNVYRTLVQPEGANAHIGYTFGYIGSTIAPSFTDTNIIPDFVDTPRRYRDPFAPGRVMNVTVVSSGSGYTDTYTSLTIASASGFGFVGYPIIKGGEVIGVYIAHHGEGYRETDTLTLVAPSGTGATFALATAPLSGTWPSISFEFQQRTGFAGTYDEPMSLWVSELGSARGFGFAGTLAANDPYEFELDAATLTPIRHVLPVQQGLLIFTAAAVTALRAEDGAAITALSSTLDQQSFIGAARVPPVGVEEDVLYVESRNKGVRLLVFNGISRKYDNREISLLARHMFPGKAVAAMAFAAPAQRTGYIVFDDGTALGVTIDRAQETFAFSEIWTDGLFRDVVFENLPTKQTAHFLVERRLGTQTVLLWEYIDEHRTQTPEDQFYLDGALETARNYHATDVVVDAFSGDIVVSAGAPVFSGRRNHAVWLREGRGVITEVISPEVARITLTRAINASRRAGQGTQIRQGDWWTAPFVDEVANIPYEGAVVSVLADGKEQVAKLVSGGRIALDFPAAVVQVGFSYAARLRTLPVSILEGIEVRLTSAVLDVGISGAFTIDGYEYNNRTDEAWNEPGSLEPRTIHVALGSGWDYENSITLESDNALPCEIRKIVLHVEGQNDRQ